MLEVIEKTPTPEEFEELIAAVGFRSHILEAAAIALENSIFTVCAMKDGELIGMGRIVGDRAISFLLTGIIVKPEHQQKDAGTKIVEKLLNLMRALSHKNMMLEVVPLPELHGFYHQFGFRSSQDAPPGMVKWFNVEQ